MIRNFAKFATMSGETSWFGGKQIRAGDGGKVLEPETMGQGMFEVSNHGVRLAFIDEAGRRRVIAASRSFSFMGSPRPLR